MSETPELIYRALPAREGEAPHPALVLLHGRGSNELDLLGLGPYLDPRFFVVSVRAPYAWQGGYRWYEQEGPGRESAETFGQSLQKVLRFLDYLAETYPIDPQRLYLLGFSQGAMMSNAVTLTVPERIAGAVLLSGFQPALDALSVNPAAVEGKPFFVAHGTADPMLGIDMGRNVRDTLDRLGVDLTYREYDMAHQVIGPELEDFNTWLTDRLDGR